MDMATRIAQAISKVDGALSGPIVKEMTIDELVEHCQKELKECQGLADGDVAARLALLADPLAKAAEILKAALAAPVEKAEQAWQSMAKVSVPTYTDPAQKMTTSASPSTAPLPATSQIASNLPAVQGQTGKVYDTFAPPGPAQIFAKADAAPAPAPEPPQLPAPVEKADEQVDWPLDLGSKDFLSGKPQPQTFGRDPKPAAAE